MRKHFSVAPQANAGTDSGRSLHESNGGRRAGGRNIGFKGERKLIRPAIRRGSAGTTFSLSEKEAAERKRLEMEEKRRQTALAVRSALTAIRFGITEECSAVNLSVYKVVLSRCHFCFYADAYRAGIDYQEECLQELFADIFSNADHSMTGDCRSRALRDLRFLSALRPSEEAYRRAIAGVRAAERREDLQQAMFQIVPLLGARDLYFLFLTAAEMPEKPMRLFLRTLDGLCQREEKTRCRAVRAKRELCRELHRQLRGIEKKPKREALDGICRRIRLLEVMEPESPPIQALSRCAEIDPAGLPNMLNFLLL